jgi:hypothetical protein
MSDSGPGSDPGQRGEEFGAAPGEATFRVRCPDCGPQHVAASDLRFVETVPQDAADVDGVEEAADAAGPTNRYVFVCPECSTRVRRPAGPELSEILRSSGVATLALHRGPGLG